eukprot:TRINITY_DN19_c0_g1_i24.p1 TRINITY_DN19_c0_g1~~TRINITY_DN19_c0_g1_i24.p1  ORF type:complete len:176 (-),score=35.82 TRINITY_DN19_c0_g1_i24:63-590(-)
MKHQDKNVLLHLWDTAGQEDYDRLRPLSYPGSDIVLLCFSLVTEGSLDSIKEKWFPEVDHYLPETPTILVGTKADLRDSKTPDPSTGEFSPVSDEQVQALAKEIGSQAFIPVSAKTGTNLKKVFEQAVALVIQRDPDAEGHCYTGKPQHSGSPDNIVFVPKTGQGRKNAGGCVLF